MRRQFYILLTGMLFGVAMVFAQTSNQYYLSYDGDDYLKYADDDLLGMMDGAADYTIEVWIYPDSNSATYDRVLQRYYSFNIVLWHIDAEKDSADWYFTVWDDGGESHYFNAQKSIAFNTWNHLAVINNSSDGSLKLYVNGEEVTTQTYGNTALRASHSSDNFYVGQWGNGTDFFSGFIDEVRLKNVAEEPGDLNEDQNQNYASDANTAVLLHMDEGTGSMTQNSATAEGDSARLGGTDIGDAAEPAWMEWTPSFINEAGQMPPQVFVLNQNYPNPFNPETEIGYWLGALKSVNLSVYNILGKKIKTLVNKTQQAGNYTVRFDGSRLAAGVYFYRLRAGNRVLTRKMILTK